MYMSVRHATSIFIFVLKFYQIPEWIYVFMTLNVRVQDVFINYLMQLLLLFKHEHPAYVIHDLVSTNMKDVMEPT